MKIYVAILHTGWIKSELSFQLIKWLRESKYDIHYEFSNLSPIAHNRNTIVKKFLESDCDYLLQIDNDNIPAKNPLELIDIMNEKQLDVLSCPVWIYQHKKLLNVYKYDKEGYLIPLNYKEYSFKGLVEVDATGSGVLLCSRKVLQSIQAPFERKFDENGIETRGLDLYFCDKAKEKDFAIFTHMDYIAQHYKTVDLSILL